ncbi:MAG: hypothetical protein KAH57_09915, partial [Thermoplasmata archaeon]|nr:hypothetical protein [Thermoplasmata archaeon]
MKADSTRAFAGGDGTVGNPYQISDVDQLQDMSSDLSAHYLLINDVDASATSGWNTGDGFDPIGNSMHNFTGSLDGQGYDINDLFINRIATSYVGLIAYLGADASLDNISLIELNISGNYQVGGLAGSNDGTVSNCYVTGSVKGVNRDIGGLVGHNDPGTVKNCFAICNVIGDYYVGGLVGMSEYDGSIYNCSASGDVSGTESVGGLVGRLYGGAGLSNCHATGNVIGTGEYIGGLVGESDGSLVDNCSTSGDVHGDRYVGGLLGHNLDGTVSICSASGDISGTGTDIGGLAGSNDIGTVKNCSASGNVSGIDNRIGGLVGSNIDGTVSNCYASGNVSSTGYAIGGLVGDNDGPVSNCYASGNVSGNDEIGGLVGENDGLISDCYATGSVSGIASDIGGLVGYNGGPVSHCYATGSVSGTGNGIGGLLGYSYLGTISDCYATGNVSGNDFISGLVGENYGSISDCYATGSASGREKIGGIIGSNNGPISNCSASGNINGDVEVGGLVGYNTDRVSNCSATGSVSGTSDLIGGLVGNNYEGTILSCYATGNVNGTGTEIGGLVGSTDGTIENCYATGSIGGDNYLGGLVGYNEGSGPVSNCYSTGSVSGIGTEIGGFMGYKESSSTVEDCFWDTENSGIATSDGGTGKTTSELKQGVTFTGAGWNFIDTWSLIEDKTYPYLNNITYPAPIVTGIDLITIYEDQAYMVEYGAETSLPGCTDFSWEIDTDAAWLAISADGVLSGTPGNDDVGNHSVDVICKDPRSVSITRSFTLSVLNTNDAPEINITYTNATEDVLYSVVLFAIDIDLVGDTLTWTLESGPAWLELNTTTSTLNGTPLNSDVGTAEVNVSVDDGNGGSDWQNFTITVENTNDDPIIITTPMNTTLQDELYSVTLNATDEDPVLANFTWSMETNVEWLELNGTYLNGTPGNSDVGTFWVNI